MVTENGSFRSPPQAPGMGDHDIPSRRRIPNPPRLDPLRINPPFPRPSTAEGLRPPHSPYRPAPSPLPRSPRKYPAHPPRLDISSRAVSPGLGPDDGPYMNRPTYHTPRLPAFPGLPHERPMKPPPTDGEFDRLPGRMTPPDQTDLPIPMSTPRSGGKHFRTYRRHTPSPHGLALPRNGYHGWAPDPQGEDMLRSSVNSAMTSRSSIEHASGTERSSVLTKSSSITDLSPDTPDGPFEKDEGMSVEDAISMYLDGFSDVTEEPASPGLLDDSKLKPPCPLPPAELTLDNAPPVSADSFDSGRSSHTHSEPTEPHLNPPDQNLVDKQFLGEERSDENPIDKPIESDLEPASQAQPPPTPRPETKIIVPGVVPPPLLTATESRDCYGFRKATTYVTLQQYESWSGSYADFAANRRVKWTELLRESGLPTTEPTTFPPKSTKMKRFVRKGIPAEYRGAAWFWYAGGYEHLHRNPGLYDQLVKQAMESDSNDDKEHIERDLHRTFPDNIHFKPEQTDLGAGSGSSKPGQGSGIVETEMIRSLRRVLYAFAIHNPRIGYTQSLNFITGLLLLFLPEEKAFWMLHIITSVYLPSTHEISLEGANIDLWILMVLLKDSLPNVYNKIAGAGPGKSKSAAALTVHSRLPDITLGMTNWLMSIFIGTLPLETTLRVWDVFFYEGSKTFFRVSMGIFKACEKEILAVSDPMEVFQVVQTVPKKLLDASSLLDDSFSRRNRVGQGRIEELRTARRAAVRQDKLRRSVAMSKGQLHAATDEWPERSRTPIPGVERSLVDSWRHMRHHAFR